MKKNSRPNPIPLKPEEKFEMPSQVLNMLNECTKGGYILLYVNESGNPDVITECDSEIVALGLQKFGVEYFNTIDNAYKRDIFNTVSEDLNS